MNTNLALSTTSPLEQTESHIEYSRTLLKSNFLADSRPWVVAYSGGKDSTLVLQLVYELLLSLDSTQHKPVYIVSSDTRVEAPNIESYLEGSIAAINKHATTSNLPIHAELIQPEVDQGFWGNLIGKGYPPPTRWFRWCTSKMKIKPVKSAIEDVIRKHGSVYCY